jgi:hypothetical protein
MYKRAEVEAMAQRAVAEHYKVAFIGAATKAMGTVGKALQSGWGARGAGQGLMQGAKNVAQGFHDAGGTKALGRLGATAAAVGGAGYMAGRGFGAGQQAAQPQQPMMQQR